MQFLTFLILVLVGYFLWTELVKRIDRLSRRGFSAGSYKFTIMPFRAIRDHKIFRQLSRNQRMNLSPIEITYLSGEDAYLIKEGDSSELVLRSGRTLQVFNKLVAGKEEGKHLGLLIREESHFRVVGKPTLVGLLYWGGDKSDKDSEQLLFDLPIPLSHLSKKDFESLGYEVKIEDTVWSHPMGIDQEANQYLSASKGGVIIAIDTNWGY